VTLLSVRRSRCLSSVAAILELGRTRSIDHHKSKRWRRREKLISTILLRRLQPTRTSPQRQIILLLPKSLLTIAIITTGQIWYRVTSSAARNSRLYFDNSFLLFFFIDYHFYLIYNHRIFLCAQLAINILRLYFVWNIVRKKKNPKTVSNEGRRCRYIPKECYHDWTVLLFSRR